MTRKLAAASDTVGGKSSMTVFIQQSSSALALKD
jgi:hypothetical protein